MRRQQCCATRFQICRWHMSRSRGKRPKVAPNPRRHRRHPHLPPPCPKRNRKLPSQFHLPLRASRIEEEVHEKLRPVTVATVYDRQPVNAARAEHRYVNARVREKTPPREKED